METSEDCLKVQERQDRESIDCYQACDARVELLFVSTPPTGEHPEHVRIVGYRLAYLHEEDCLDKGG